MFKIICYIFVNVNCYVVKQFCTRCKYAIDTLYELYVIGIQSFGGFSAQTAKPHNWLGINDIYKHMHDLHLAVQSLHLNMSLTP